MSTNKEWLLSGFNLEQQRRLRLLRNAVESFEVNDCGLDPKRLEFVRREVKAGRYTDELPSEESAPDVTIVDSEKPLSGYKNVPYEIIFSEYEIKSKPFDEKLISNKENLNKLIFPDVFMNNFKPYKKWNNDNDVPYNKY